METNSLVKPLWSKVFKNSIFLMIALYILLGVLRVAGLYAPPQTVVLVLLGFLSMWFLPVIFLSKEGRRQIGLRKPNDVKWTFIGIISAITAAFLIFIVGYALFGKSPDNWLISVKNTYLHGTDTSKMPVFVLFVIYTIPAVIFSPIGEEFFFRGMIQEVFARRWGVWVGAIVNSFLFALAHLFHHGLQITQNGVQLRLVSGSIWFILIFLSGLMLTPFRYKTDSLIPGIISHAVFNLVMNFTIFYFLM